MKIYIFGNRDVESDKIPQEIIENIKKDFGKNIVFHEIKPNEDIPFENKANVVILDIIRHLKNPKLLDESYIDMFSEAPRTSVHDFDLSFQLKYLKKLGKLKKVNIIGIPMGRKIDYSSIQFIIKKLVAQDMQGS